MDERSPAEPPEPVDRYRELQPASLAADSPHWTLWLVYLLFRPGLFFETYVLRSVPVLTVLTAWLFGIAGTMDQIETRVLLSPDTSPLYATLQSDWRMYWGAAALFGILSGALQYSVGGWWYRVRLRWSGANDPDKTLARRVYVYASQAYVVPFLLYTAWETTAYDTPAAAATGDDLAAFLVIIALYWSIYVSYRGVRTAFDVKAWPARIWFGILPAMLCSLVLAAFIGALLFGALGAALEDPPDLANPRRIEGDGFEVEVPGNWEVDLDDPENTLAVGPVFADAVLTLWLHDEPMDASTCVNRTVGNFAETYDLSVTTPIETWGHFEGAGYLAEAEIEGATYTMILFCSTERPRPLEIMLISETENHALVAPGFDLIRDSLELMEGE